MKNSSTLKLLAATALLAACAQAPSPPTALTGDRLKAAQACAEPLATLVPDTGNYSRSIATNADAQAFFDQGLRLTLQLLFS